MFVSPSAKKGSLKARCAITTSRSVSVGCEAFVEKKFQAKTLELIGKVNGVIDEYVNRRFVLTLRQLFYQLVARMIVENLQSEYKRIGSIVNDARLAGLIDWDAIEDRTRYLRELPWWTSPSDVVAAAANQYREDIWRDQPTRFEVWIEKDALLGVIEGICKEYRAPYFACRGNNSQSEAYRAGHRIRQHLADGLAAGAVLAERLRDRAAALGRSPAGEAAGWAVMGSEAATTGLAAFAGRSSPHARHVTAGCAHQARICVSTIISAVSPTLTLASTSSAFQPPRAPIQSAKSGADFGPALVRSCARRRRPRASSARCSAAALALAWPSRTSMAV